MRGPNRIWRFMGIHDLFTLLVINKNNGYCHFILIKKRERKRKTRNMYKEICIHWKQSRYQLLTFDTVLLDHCCVTICIKLAKSSLQIWRVCKHRKLSVSFQVICINRKLSKCRTVLRNPERSPDFKLSGNYSKPNSFSFRCPHHRSGLSRITALYYGHCRSRNYH